MAKKQTDAPAAKKKAAQQEAKPLTGTPRLKTKYLEQAVPALKEQFHYENVMQVLSLIHI